MENMKELLRKTETPKKPREGIAFAVKPEEYEEIDKICIQLGLTKSEYFRRLHRIAYKECNIK